MSYSSLYDNHSSGAKLDSELNFGVVEAYKTIRTNLNFAITKKDCKVIMLASALPAEGKTTTCVNLAITIAQTGAKVLIIDADLRKPRVHSKFGKVNDIGLSNLLSGMCSIDDVQKDTGKTNLMMITSGAIPPNPAELLSSPAMDAAISELRTKYDYVLIDTPPINIIADALPVTKICDGVIMVVKNKTSTHPSMKDALASLKFAGANILGVVFNGIDAVPAYKRTKYKYKYKNYEYTRYYTHSEKSKGNNSND